MSTTTHRLRRGLALATVIGALAAPAASAAPIDPAVPGTSGDTTSESYGGSLNSIAPPVSSPEVVAEPSAVADDGFDWGDAGIGAAGMLAVAAIAAGAAVAVAHRPGRQPAA